MRRKKAAGGLVTESVAAAKKAAAEIVDKSVNDAKQAIGIASEKSTVPQADDDDQDTEPNQKETSTESNEK